MNFHEDPSTGGPAVPCGQTDRRNADNSHFLSQCREPRLKLPKLYALTSSRNDTSVLQYHVIRSADV